MKRSYGFNLLLALDQSLNAIFWGNPDETISSRAYRGRINGSRKWTVIEKIIDILFFYDRITTDSGELIKHCELSFLFYLRRKKKTLADYMKEEYESLLEFLKNT